jgi:hypothetical protein
VALVRRPSPTGGSLAPTLVMGVDARPTTLRHRLVEVTRYLGASRQVRKAVRFNGLTGPRNLGVHNNSLANLERAVMERVFYCQSPAGEWREPPQPELGATVDLLPFRRAVSVYAGATAPITHEQFVELYRGSKRKAYAEAAADLALRPLQRKDAFLEPFVKGEKIDFDSKADPTPRVIQPRGRRYNVVVGCYIKPMEKRIYKAINRVFRDRGSVTKTVLKGLNLSQRARVLRRKWERFRRPVAFGADAKRFDQHVSAIMLRFEHGLYAACTSPADRAALAELLSWQVDNVAYGRTKDGKVKFKRLGGRASGDMNTALGNVFLMCAMVHALLEQLGVDAELADDGDDFVLIMEEEDAPRVRAALDAHFLRFGFEMTVEEVVRIFEQVDICQTRPVWDGVEWVMVRKPEVGVSKDALALGYISEVEEQLSWLGSVGKCGMAGAGGIPIYHSLYSAMVSSAGGRELVEAPVTGFLLNTVGMNRSGKQVTDESRVSFWLAFGFDPYTQILIEQQFRVVVCPSPDTSERARIIWPAATRL